MTKIAISGLYADSTPAAHVGFTVRLRDAGSGGAIDDGVIVAPLHGTLDASGEAEVDLTPNEDVTPAGTFYAITVAVSPTVVRYIEVPQPNGSGEAEVPYAWGDPTIQLLVSDAPTHIPAPEGGTVGDVLTVVDPGDGKRYSLEAATGGAEDDSDLTVTSTAAYLKSATTVAAYTAAAGSAGVSAARQASTSAILPFVITAAGSTQAQINTNAANGAGWAQVSADVAADTAVEASLLALDGEAALRSATDGPVTVRQFDLGADWDTEGHDDRGWSTPFPGTFSGGIWLEAPVTVTGERLPASPTDGQTVYTEIPAIYADGVGNHDLLEWAVESTWYAALGQWIHRLYYEHTSSAAPGAAEDYELSYAGVADGWRFTENQPTRVAAWVDFTDGTNSTGYLLREAPAGTVGDMTLRGRQWRIILKKIGPPTDIDPSISDDLHIGSGHGRILVPELIILNGGPNGTGYASPNAADAWAEGDGPFDDPDGNTWTKDPSGSTIAGTTPSGATTDASELTSGILPAARIGDASITAAKIITSGLPIWQTVANTVLGSASSSQSFDITGYRCVRVTFMGRSNRAAAQDSIRLRFNGDTGNNYSTDTGALTDRVQAFSIAGEQTNADRAAYVVIQWAYMAGSWLVGTAMGEAPASTATTGANVVSTGFVWTGAVSAAPTSVLLYPGFGQFVAGSSFLVEARA